MYEDTAQEKKRRIAEGMRPQDFHKVFFFMICRKVKKLDFLITLSLKPNVNISIFQNMKNAI